MFEKMRIIGGGATPRLQKGLLILPLHKLLVPL